MVTGTYVESAGPVSIYRSPNGGAEQAILSAIDHARTRILVEAYSFTSAPIYEALANAKARGVDVRILVDKDARDAGLRGAGARYELAHGVPLMVGELAGRGIAHSKVMVIDAATVITGSFNFSRQAETTNVENPVVFHDSRQIADTYTAIWNARAVQAAR